MGIPVVARWCKFSPADMSNSFVQRGGWWVVGQFLLLLAIASLDITGHAAMKPLPFFIGGLVLIAAACDLQHRRAAGVGAKPDAVSQAIGQDRIGPAWHLSFDSASALHFRFLCRRRFVTYLSKLAGLGRFPCAGSFL